MHSLVGECKEDECISVGECKEDECISVHRL